MNADVTRLVSMEVGRPLMIDDDDCEVREPTPVDDEYIHTNSIGQPPPGASPPNGLVSVIPVVRIYAQLKKTLKYPTIGSQTLATFDAYFQAIMQSYPHPFPIHSPDDLDPRLLTAACSLPTAQFFLYRHNLSSACSRAERHEALDRCVVVANDTVRYIRRSMQQDSRAAPHGVYSPGHMTNWGARLRTMAPAFFCSHLWRCALVLCLRLEFASAATIVQASASIGDLRKNNIACGRNLAFFVEKLIGRLRSGATRESLEEDEEMLAYASGDLQASVEEAWAWTGSETGANLSKRSNGLAPLERTNSISETQTSSALTGREMHEWGGWDNILRTLDQLHQQQHGQTPPPQAQMYAQPGTYPPPPQTPNLHLGTQPPLPPQQQQLPSPSLRGSTGNGNSNGTGSSRISIKDIMGA
jgi:hypothetical protein